MAATYHTYYAPPAQPLDPRDNMYLSTKRPGDKIKGQSGPGPGAPKEALGPHKRTGVRGWAP